MTQLRSKTDVSQGTLDLLILKTLSLEPMHGVGISRRLEQTTRGVGLIAAGLDLGLVGAYGLTRFLESQLFGVSPTDLSVYAGVATLTAVVGLVACYLPARRAAKLDPIVTLRFE